MKESDLAAMHAVESNHWWFVGKRLLFERLLAVRLRKPGLAILDVGCGTGGNAQTFSRYGRVTACDRSPAALRMARRGGLRDLVASDAAELPFRSESFDLVLALDVIEHVDDDRKMLAELRRVLRPGGAVAIHVPAWPFLWSNHDVALEHRRRYTRRSLARLIADCALRTERFGWSSAAIFPPAVALRMLRPLLPAKSTAADLYPLPAPLNRLMVSVYRVEAALAERGKLPIGLSLAAVVRR